MRNDHSFAPLFYYIFECLPFFSRFMAKDHVYSDNILISKDVNSTKKKMLKNEIKLEKKLGSVMYIYVGTSVFHLFCIL